MIQDTIEAAAPTFAVLGAGNGGLAMAGHLALRGFRVRLYNRTPERIAALQTTATIQITSQDGGGLPHGRAELDRVTADLPAALDGASLVMVVTPATAHRDLAERCAPHLADGQIVVLHPGRTGGALEFAATLRRHGCRSQVVVAEAQTLLYACRAANPGQVHIFGIKNCVPVAAIPAYRTPEVLAALRPAFTEFIPGDNVMKTSLDNIGAIFHPAVTVLNAGRIESTRGDFEYYIEGISSSVARLLERIDAERVAVGAAMGFRCTSAREWLYLAYGASGGSLFEAIRANQGYYGIKAPPLLAHRYLDEDVPMSLVPIASLGRQLGVPCPTIEATVTLAEGLRGVDYGTMGRTARTMGVEDLSLADLRRFILEGERR